MIVQPTDLPGVLLIEPRVFRDERGYFLETWSEAASPAAGLPAVFRQDNLSLSHVGVLRGLHYQFPVAQGKLVSVVRGEVFDVAVDIRVGSPTFGHWVGVTLSASSGQQLYIPEGFAHGFQVVGTEDASFAYKCTTGYDPTGQCSIRWDDPDLGIAWPLPPTGLAAKDANAPCLRDVPPDRLPRFEPSTPR